MAASAAASGFSKKPHFLVQEKSSKIHKIPCKSHSNIFFKSLIIVLILLIVPFFPSQAPDFITQTILTEFWEIFHLIFIGIVVSYGLFSRKTDLTDTEETVHSRIDGFNEYLSGISHLSSVFEDGFEIFCGSDEQDMVSSYANLQSGDYDEFLGKKIRSFDSKDDNVKRVTQQSRYLKGESLVVVSNGNDFLDEMSEIKPLNLPVRSLRSRVVENDRPELRNRSKPSPKFEDKDNDKVNVVKIRGTVPRNLEKKFEEVSGPSSIPWRSRSGRIETGGVVVEMSNFNTPTHYRPQSVGEFEFENLKSSSFSEFASSKVESLEGKRGFRKNVVSVSNRKIVPLDDETLSNHAKTRPFSIGAFSEMNNGEKENERLGKGKQDNESFDLDMKSPSLAKALSKAKSVRTIKPGRHIVDEKDKFETNSSVKRGRGDENQDFDSIFAMPKPKPILLEINSGEKEFVHDDRKMTDSEDDSRSEFESSSDEDNDDGDDGTNHETVAELEGSEVDRKAGEFIAKFREQIRLQRGRQLKDATNGSH